MPWLTSHLSTALVIGAGVAFPIVLVLLALLLLFWVKIYTLVSYTLLSSVLFKPQSHAAADTEGVQMRQFLKTSLVAISVLATLLAAKSFAGDLPSRYAPPPVIGGGPGTKVGVLNCRIAPHVGLIVVGFQTIDCRFTSERPGPSENYSGRMTTVGMDLGFTGGGALTWGVYARTNNMVPGSLSGSYSGASGNLGVVVGAGANFLLGGSGNSVALQPWSVEGTTGVNASLGLSNMELRPVL